MYIKRSIVTIIFIIALFQEKYNIKKCEINFWMNSGLFWWFHIVICIILNFIHEKNPSSDCPAPPGSPLLPSRTRGCWRARPEEGLGGAKIHDTWTETMSTMGSSVRAESAQAACIASQSSGWESLRCRRNPSCIVGGQLSPNLIYIIHV